MKSRPFSLFFSALLIAATAFVFLLVPTGCNPIGCFRASEAGGSCPSRDEALEFFGDPACGSQVASVDSEASVKNGTAEEGALCCYAITNQEPDYSGCPDF